MGFDTLRDALDIFKHKIGTSLFRRSSNLSSTIETKVVVKLQGDGVFCHNFWLW